MVFAWDFNSRLSTMSDQHSLVMKGCIIWHTKHVSSYEARATKLMCHTYWEKNETIRWSELYHFCKHAAMKPYMLYWPSTRDGHCFPESVFAVIWLFSIRLPACPSTNCWSIWKSTVVVQELQGICFAAVSIVRITRHIDQSTRHLCPGLRKWL